MAVISNNGRSGGYLSPGVYFNQGRAVGDAVASTNPFSLCIVGVGSRTKRNTNEAIQRAAKVGEELTVASASPHTSTLQNRALRQKTNFQIFNSNGVQLADNEYSFNRASLQSEDGPFDFTSTTGTNTFTLRMDGKAELIIHILEDASATGVTGVLSGTLFNSATVDGRYVLIEGAFASTGAATAAEFADAVNIALRAATSAATGLSANEGYGDTYRNSASVSGSAVVLTSPAAVSEQVHDVVVGSSPFNSGLIELFGVNTEAVTTITISDDAFESDVVYTANYINLDPDDYDEFSVENADQIVSVGSRPSLREYQNPRDYLPDLVNNNGITWNPGLPAIFTSTSPGPYDLSSSDLIQLDIDGNGPVVIDLVGDTSVVSPDYADPISPSAATPTEVAANINAALSTHPLYGPQYANVASVVTEVGLDFIVITSPTNGRLSSVHVKSPVSSSATEAIFGDAAPPQSIGSGIRPSPGTIYYATYDSRRSSNEYDRPILHIGRDAFFAAIGNPSQQNPLAVHGEIAFENGVERLYTIQIDDASSLRAPNRTEINRALDSLNTNESITDVVLLENDQVSRVDFTEKLIELNSLAISRYCRGYIGAPRDTDIGDASVPDSYVYIAANEFSAPLNNIDLRGRQFLISPSNVSRTILNSDLSETKLALDGGACAVAVAALRTLLNPGESMASKTITGLDIDDFQELNSSEVAQLASNGVTHVTLDAGRLILLDPKPTEQFGEIRFELDNFATQNDNLQFAIADGLRANFVGVTPTSVSDFAFEIKVAVSRIINSQISLGFLGPYLDESGQERPLSLSEDLVVRRSPDDPRSWFIGAFGTTRVAALRFFVTLTLRTS